MPQPLIYTLNYNAAYQAEFAQALNAEAGTLEHRAFPDGEHYLRVLDAVDGRDTLIVCQLSPPDQMLLPMLLLADTLRELGAKSVGLVLPYLPYMRQDKRFHPGECVSSKPFAKLLSRAVDWLVTADPHLHRYTSLDEIYSIPSTVVSAMPEIGHWIAREVPRPVLIGPDSESEQWVAEVARSAGAPYQILSKTRRGDYDVEVSQAALSSWQGHTPILVDDIISSGRTLMATLAQFEGHQLNQPICIGVHGVFADDAWQQLSKQADIITSNSIIHSSNEINLIPVLAHAACKHLKPIPE